MMLREPWQRLRVRYSRPGMFFEPCNLVLYFMVMVKVSCISEPAPQRDCAALFFLLNSISGLLGNISATKSIPTFALPLGIAVVIGGTLGSYLGINKLQPLTIKRLLAVVLTIAGFKLILA